MTIKEKVLAGNPNTNEDKANKVQTLAHNHSTIHAHLRDFMESTRVQVATKAGEHIPAEHALAVYLDMREVNRYEDLGTAPIHFCTHCLQAEYDREVAKRIEEERRKEAEAERKARQATYDQIARDVTNGEAISECELEIMLVDAKRKGKAGWEKFLNAMVAIDQKRLDDLGLDDWTTDLEEDEAV
ncbi:hypothetical protein [Corynebacterium diphtheriae]|uniref:hypothetical protein n=1 Tax=Corynebacterium diphtheriae TaxID=1717 RepID=UPI000B53BB60|nr:hypothetical protein [Corynebacterium diphtheriae]OWX99870.1 hypothetical protein B1A53_02565 [Corynebacterium diphtheriae]CAB0804753.1 hypothetical protein FRC0292_00494 [Corynebacterium diphtheriae]